MTNAAVPEDRGVARFSRSPQRSGELGGRVRPLSNHVPGTGFGAPKMLAARRFSFAAFSRSL